MHVKWGRETVPEKNCGGWLQEPGTAERIAIGLPLTSYQQSAAFSVYQLRSSTKWLRIEFCCLTLLGYLGSARRESADKDNVQLKCDDYTDVVAVRIAPVMEARSDNQKLPYLPEYKSHGV